MTDHEAENVSGLFDNEFQDEPPLVDLVPGAISAYERNRSIRRLGTVGGGIAAVAAVAVGVSQLPSAQPAASVATNPTPTSPTHIWSPSPIPTVDPTAVCTGPWHVATQPPPTGPGFEWYPRTDQRAHSVCATSIDALASLLPQFTWVPRRAQNPSLMEPSAFVPSVDLNLHVGLGPKYYPKGGPDIGKCDGSIASQCSPVTLAFDMEGSVSFFKASVPKNFDQVVLAVDLPGGAQAEFELDTSPGAPTLLDFSQFKTMVEQPEFAVYLTKYIEIAANG